MAYNQAEYESVAERLTRFKGDHPNFRMFSEIAAHTSIKDAGTRWIIKVTLFRDEADEYPVSNGFAEERDGGQGANRAAALENAETSALGRALANAGYAGSKRVTREELAKTVAVDDIERELPAADLAGLRELWKQASEAGVLPTVQKKLKDRKKELETSS